MAPVRITSSGRWASIQAPWPNELVRACDHQAPVVAPGPEAGQRVREDRDSRCAAASAASASGRSESSSGPATMRPRSTPARRPASRVDLGVIERAPAVDTGREPRLDALVAQRTVRQQRLAERHVEMHGTRGSGERRRDRATRQRPHVRRGRRIAVEQRQLREPLRLSPVEVVLVDRLRRSPVAQLGGPVGREHDQRDARVRGLDHRRPELHRRGPGRDQHDDRPAIGPGHAHREEARGALVEQHAHPQVPVRPQRERKRRGPRPGADDGVAHAGRDQLGDERPEQRRVAHRSSAGMPSAVTTARSLMRDSSHSAAASESATMPQPANRRGPGAVDDPAAQGDAQLAVAVRAQPADGAGVPAAVEPLVLVDQRERDVARLTAHRRRRVQEPGHRQQPARLGQRARDLGRQVLDEPERHDRGLGRDLERLGDRRQLGPDRVHDDGLLLAILLGGEQVSGQGRVLGGIGAAADRAGHGHRPERAAFGSREALGRRAQERPAAAPEREGRALGCARGQPAKGVRDVELDGRPEPHPPGEHHLVDPSAADRSREHADQAVPGLVRRLLGLDRERREHGPRDHAVRARLELPGASLQRRPSPVEVIRRVDRRPRERRAVARQRIGQLRQDQRGRAERRPDVVVAGSPAREPQPAHQDRARARDARRPDELLPGPLGLGESIGSIGLRRPGTPDADQRDPVGGAQPQGGLEVRLDRRRVERDRVDRADRHRHRGERGTPVVASGEQRREARTQRRRRDIRAPAAGPHRGHRGFSGKSAPAAMAGTATRSMRSSGTPTDRSRIARRAGYASSRRPA